MEEPVTQEVAQETPQEATSAPEDGASAAAASTPAPASQQAPPPTPTKRPLRDVLSEYDPQEVQRHFQPEMSRRERELRERWERETKQKAEETARQDWMKTADPAEVGRWIQEQEKYKEAVAGHSKQLGEHYSAVISNLFTDLFRNAQPVLSLLPKEEAQAVYEMWTTTVPQVGIDKGIPLFNKQLITKMEAAIRADERKKAVAEFEKEKVALKTSWEAERNGERPNPDLTRGGVVSGLTYEEVMSWPMPKRAQWELEHPQEKDALYESVLTRRNGR